MLLAFTVLASISLKCQSTDESTIHRPENNFKLCIGGNASLISLSYEKLEPLSKSVMLAIAGGIGYNKEFRLCLFGPCTEPLQKYITFPHSVTLNWGSRRSHLEFGLGGAIITGKTNHHYLLCPSIGYRHHPLKPNKIGFQVLGSYPLTNPESADFMFIPIGINVGVAF